MKPEPVITYPPELLPIPEADDVVEVYADGALVFRRIPFTISVEELLAEFDSQVGS